MIHIGMDLHKKSLTVYGLNDVTGEEVTTRIGNNSREVMDFINGLEGNKQVAGVATRNWYWLVDLLQKNKIEVILSNPLQTKAIASARISDPESRARRELLRYRMKVVRMRPQVKNNVRAILSKKNIKPTIEYIWGVPGQKYLAGLKWEEPHKTIIEQSLEQIKMLDRQIEELNKKNKSTAKINVAIRLAKIVYHMLKNNWDYETYS